MLVIIWLVTFGAVTSLALYLMQPRTNAIRQRILNSTSPNDLPRQRRVEGSASTRLVTPLIDSIGTRLARLLPGNMLKHIEDLVTQAAVRSSSRFLYIWFVTSLGSIVFALLMFS